MLNLFLNKKKIVLCNYHLWNLNNKDIDLIIYSAKGLNYNINDKLYFKFCLFIVKYF